MFVLGKQQFLQGFQLAVQFFQFGESLLLAAFEIALVVRVDLLEIDLAFRFDQKFFHELPPGL